ncbi:MAG: hypothetical protein ACREDO_12550 [Methyloceanibacter sp.]
MLKHTRRRALALLIAAGAGARLVTWPRHARADKPDCFDQKNFPPWKVQASNDQAGASMTQVKLGGGQHCDLQADIQISSSYDAKLTLYVQEGGKTELHEDFLVKPENRLIAKTADGKEAINVALCGNCTDIYENSLNIVLPLATAPLFREEDSVILAMKLGDKPECSMKLDCVALRKGLAWGEERRDALAKKFEDDKCTPPEDCFITNACCGLLGLDEDCFELRTLRRYRDTVLARQPGGAEIIARYYRLAPLILTNLPDASRAPRLLAAYARHILPAAIAACLGLNALAYRLYAGMIEDLAATYAPHPATGAAKRAREERRARQADDIGSEWPDLSPPIRAMLSRLLDCRRSTARR